MKNKIILILFSILLVSACSSYKDSQQRRNLMIPQKNELPKNKKKYSGSKKKKTYKPKKVKSKKKKY